MADSNQADDQTSLIAQVIAFGLVGAACCSLAMYATGNDPWIGVAALLGLIAGAGITWVIRRTQGIPDRPSAPQKPFWPTAEQRRALFSANQWNRAFWSIAMVASIPLTVIVLWSPALLFFLISDGDGLVEVAARVGVVGLVCLSWRFGLTPAVRLGKHLFAHRVSPELGKMYDEHESDRPSRLRGVALFWLVVLSVGAVLILSRAIDLPKQAPKRGGKAAALLNAGVWLRRHPNTAEVGSVLVLSVTSVVVYRRLRGDNQETPSTATDDPARDL